MFRRIAIIAALALASAVCGFADSHRAVRNRVQPTYPPVARQMKLQGVVKLQVVIAPSGKVLKTTVLGGNPLLASSAQQAVSQWKFEPASSETTELIEVNFTD